jgi:hypothetical protein
MKRGTHYQYKRYRCQAWRQGGKSTAVCNASVDGSQVEALVLAELSACVTSFVATDRFLLEQIWGELARPDADAETPRQIRQFEQQAETARRRITSATQMFIDELVTKLAYDATVAAEQAALDYAEANLSRLRSTASPVVVLPPLATALDKLSGWSTALDDPLVMREVLTLLVSHVTPLRLRQRKYGIAITWTQLGSRLADVGAVA